MEQPRHSESASMGHFDPSSPSSAALTPSLVPTERCPSCGNMPASVRDAPAVSQPWVYAVGTIRPLFPNLGLEKEVAQAAGREDTKGLTDRETLHRILLAPENKYLVRQLCWVMNIGGVDTYILTPRDPSEFGRLAEVVRPNPKPGDLDVVIGLKGPNAPQDYCNGLTIPIVGFDQIYSFSRETLIEAARGSGGPTGKSMDRITEEVLDRILLITDNDGSKSEYRALNYLAVRYKAIYAKAAEYFHSGCALTDISVSQAALSGARSLFDVVFSFRNRTTDVVEKWSVRVDVTDEWPCLHSKLSPFYDIRR
jgi:PatG Domain